MPRVRSVTDGVFLATVLIDSREQHGYAFADLVADLADGGGSFAVPTRRATLQSGDYGIAGLEGLVAVERKSLADLYGTLGKGRDRFERELSRLQTFEFASVVVEASWGEVLGNPPPRSELKPKTIFRSVIAWQQRYPRVHWWFCSDRRHAEVTTFRILERFWREKQAAAIEGAEVAAEELTA